MQITQVDVFGLEIPLDSPNAMNQAVRAAVAVVRTDAGLEGLGYGLPYAIDRFDGLLATTRQLSKLLLGEDPRRPERVYQKLNPAAGWAGTGNSPSTGTTPLDMAVWDLAAKAAGQPLWRLLGGFRDRIPVYASLELGRHLPAERLPESAAQLLARGFKAVKTQAGGPGSTLRSDVQRITAVREAIGPDVKLLVDVNSNWTPAEAVRGGRALEALDLFWLEDPVPIHNLEGLAHVRQMVNIPIASAETLQNFTAFRPLFQAQAVDIPMPDVLHVGGITPFRKIAHLAECFGLPLANHLAPAISSQLVAAAPNGLIVEYVPWEWRFLRGGPMLENGDLVMSDAPGHGLELDPDFAAHHRLG